MKRTRFVAGTGFCAALVGASFGLTACVDQGSPLVIVQAQSPDSTGMSGSGCVIPAKRTDVTPFFGVLDVALDQLYPYDLYPLVANKLPALMDESSVDTNRVDVRSYHVKVDGPPSVQIDWPANCSAEFDWPASLVLGPGDEGAGYVQAIRPCQAQVIRQLFDTGKLPKATAELVFFNTTTKARANHGGSTVESDPFVFPVRVCYGCLQVGFPDPAYAGFDYPKVPRCEDLTTNPYTGNPCNPGQDAPVLCCAVNGDPNHLECPGRPRGMAKTTM